MFTNRIIVIHQHHFTDFYVQQRPDIQVKIEYVLGVVRKMEHIPTRFFKHVEGHKNLYEIRVEYESNAYRIFCCFDLGPVIVLLNAYQKTSKRIPARVLQTALRCRAEYFSFKP